MRELPYSPNDVTPKVGPWQGVGNASAVELIKSRLRLLQGERWINVVMSAVGVAAFGLLGVVAFGASPYPGVVGCGVALALAWRGQQRLRGIRQRMAPLRAAVGMLEQGGQAEENGRSLRVSLDRNHETLPLRLGEARQLHQLSLPAATVVKSRSQTLR